MVINEINKKSSRFIITNLFLLVCLFLVFGAIVKAQSQGNEPYTIKYTINEESVIALAPDTLTIIPEETFDTIIEYENLKSTPVSSLRLKVISSRKIQYTYFSVSPVYFDDYTAVFDFPVLRSNDRGFVVIRSKFKNVQAEENPIILASVIEELPNQIRGSYLGDTYTKVNFVHPPTSTFLGGRLALFGLFERINVKGTFPFTVLFVLFAISLVGLILLSLTFKFLELFTRPEEYPKSKPRAIIAFSFALRNGREPNPCNRRLARAVEEIVAQESAKGIPVVVVSQWEIALDLDHKRNNVVYVVSKHRNEGQYLDSEEVIAQAADMVFRPMGISDVIVVAHPFLHLNKCQMQLIKAGFNIVDRFKTYFRIGWIGFDPESDQPWTRSAWASFWYSVKQLFRGVLWKKVA